jgi:toxin-antitoxin system PIN domain toxin
MQCVDVNVLVYAHRPEAPHHVECREWLDHARAGPEPLGLAAIVMSGFLRVVTHPRIFLEPTPLATALEFLEVLRESPATVPVLPGDRHWHIFTDLCRRLDAKGNVVPDAFLAAVAIENGASWISADRAFAGFPGLRWRHPVDA